MFSARGGADAALASRGAAVGRRARHPRTLEGTLWVQTSAECAALATAAYRHGGQLALDDALADKTWTAATEQNGAFASLPPAVILDLDETVLDNSHAGAARHRSARSITRERWKAWVDRGEAALVAGAKAFLDYAAARGVAIFFVATAAMARRRLDVDDEAADRREPRGARHHSHRRARALPW